MSQEERHLGKDAEMGRPDQLQRKVTEEDAAIARMLKETGWDKEPLDFVNKAPIVVRTKAEFFEHMYYGDHEHTAVVWPQGIKTMGMEEDLPLILEGMEQETSVLQLMKSMPREEMRKFDGRIYSFEKNKEKKPVSKSKNGQRYANLLEKQEGLEELEREHKLGDAVTEEGDEAVSSKKSPPIYLTELRYTKEDKYKHAVDGKWSRTAMVKSVKDYLGGPGRFMPYWDRYNEGIFVGERDTGSALHIDQCLWSNVGRHWCGYKLFFTWNRKDVSKIEKFLRKIFIPPLSEEERAALRLASQVMVMRPGDVCVFTGANPHMAVSISTQLSCTSYESIINFNKRHLEIFLETNCEEKDHPEDCHIDEETLDDISYDIVDQLNDCLDWLEEGDAPDDRTTQATEQAVTFLRSTDSWFRRKIRAPHRHKHQKTDQEEESPENS
eukprot:gb/GEZN01007535.1/.p1 GENE.gb/GEZN01007535.1/~~gb/GEZN01007535.1/.p1  ORF type:complete len:439 (+),score=66.25 gb/GEZN01007535.1/:37-1353(+)